MEEKDYMEHYCDRVADLYADGMKWKKLANKAPTEADRNMAREIADMLMTYYKKEYEMLLKHFNEM